MRCQFDYYSLIDEDNSKYLAAVPYEKYIELAKVDAQVRAEELHRRQKLAVRAGAAIAASLLIGIAVSTWQAVVAIRARAKGFIDLADTATFITRPSDAAIRPIAETLTPDDRGWLLHRHQSMVAFLDHERMSGDSPFAMAHQLARVKVEGDGWGVLVLLPTSWSKRAS